MAEPPRLLSRGLLLASLALLLVSLGKGAFRKLRLVFLLLVTVQTVALLVAVARTPTLLGFSGLVLLAAAAFLAWKDFLR